MLPEPCYHRRMHHPRIGVPRSSDESLLLEMAENHVELDVANRRYNQAMTALNRLHAVQGQPRRPGWSHGDLQKLRSTFLEIQQLNEIMVEQRQLVIDSKAGQWMCLHVNRWQSPGGRHYLREHIGEVREVIATSARIVAQAEFAVLLLAAHK
jgi:hypothetical protein